MKDVVLVHPVVIGDDLGRQSHLQVEIQVSTHIRYIFSLETHCQLRACQYDFLDCKALKLCRQISRIKKRDLLRVRHCP